MAASSTTTRRRLEGKRALDLMERQVKDFGAKAFKFYNVRYDYGAPFPWRMDDPKVAFPVFEKAQELGVKLGAFGRVGFAEGDAASEADVARVTGEAVAFLGGLDTLVVSAGRSSIGSIFDATPADFQAVMDTNLLGPFLAVRAAAPHLVEGAPASVILMASVVGVIAMRERVAYCTSKAGILGMTRALALDFADRAVRVNAISPSLVLTELTRSILAQEKDPAATLKRREVWKSRSSSRQSRIGGGAGFCRGCPSAPRRTAPRAPSTA